MIDTGYQSKIVYDFCKPREVRRVFAVKGVGGVRPIVSRPNRGNSANVALFSIDTVHGSYINQTKKPRRLVRLGYRDPDNRQEYGQSFGRPGLIVSGYRERHEDDELLKGT